MSDPVLIDEVIYARWELGEDFFDEYLEYFTATSGEVKADLQTSFVAKQMDALESRAHDLKGLCSNLGLARYTKHLALMEKWARESERPSLEKALARMDSLTAEAIAALKAYKAKQLES